MRDRLVLAGLLLLASAALARDPWLEADDNLQKKGLEAARAYAESRKGPSLDSLRKYLKGAPPLEPEARRAHDKALEHANADRFREALDVLATVKTNNDTVVQGKICHLRAALHDVLNEQEPRLAALRRWAEIAEEIGWLAAEAQALHRASLAVQNLHRNEELVELYGRLAKVQELLERPDEEQVALLNLGSALTDVGRTAKALEVLPRVLAKAKENNWEDIEATAHGSIANALWKRGEYAKGIYHALRSEQLFEDLGETEGQANAASQTGALFFDLGDFDASEAAYLRVRDLIGEEGDTDAHVIMRGNLALVLGRRGEYDEAVRLLQVTVEQMRERKAWVHVGDACREIGEILLLQANLPEAIKYFDRADKHLQGDPVRRSYALAGEAHALFLAGKLDDAQRTVETALAMKGGDQAREARNRLFEVQGLILLARNRPAKAVALLRKALDLIEDVVSGLSDEQTFSAREQKARVFQVAVEAAFRTGKPEVILEFLERGRAAALRDAIGSRQALQRARLPRALAAKLERAAAAVRLARRRVEAALQGDSLVAETNARAGLKEAEENLRRVNDRAEREHKRLAAVTRTKHSSMAEIRDGLRHDEALVYYALLEQTGYAFVLTDKSARSVPLEDAAGILELCEKARRSFEKRGGADPEKITNELKRRLVTPLRLKPAVRSVIVCPDGPLSYLPWPELDERHASSVPSGSTLVLLRDPKRKRGKGKRGKGILAFGAPDYRLGARPAGRKVSRGGHRFPPLPGSGIEVDDITRDDKKTHRVFKNRNATEQVLKEALPKRPRWRAVHFACHGVIDDRFPFRSGLALTRDDRDDGLLTVPEILALEVPADLVVLSACDSGRGRFVRGEGVVGLTRAFLVAGAPLVLASTWRVDDEATRELMVRFYGQWRKGEVTAAEALRKAQDHVKAKKEKWDHPYYWAAWVLWGVPE